MWQLPDALQQKEVRPVMHANPILQMSHNIDYDGGIAPPTHKRYEPVLLCLVSTVWA